MGKLQGHLDSLWASEPSKCGGFLFFMVFLVGDMRTLPVAQKRRSSEERQPTPYSNYPLFLVGIFGKTDRFFKVNTDPFFSRGSTNRAN